MKKLLLVLCTVAGIASKGQVNLKGVIIDSKTGESIPYANVYLKNHPVGTTAFRDGSFKLQLDSLFQDSVIFSIIGYEKQSMFLPDAVRQKSLNVKLEPRQEELLEVEVKPRKMKSYEAGLVGRKSATDNGALPERPAARYISNEYQVEGFIKNVAVYVSKNGIPDAPFRVNLLRVDKVSGKPGVPLVDEDFVLKAREEGKEWVTLDIQDKLIKLPQEGFFVVVQALPIDSMQMLEYKVRLPDLDERGIRLSAPLFGHRYEDYSEAAEANWCFHCWEAYDWVSHWRLNYPKLDSINPRITSSRASSLMIKAEINYYADQKLKVKELKTKRAVKKVFDRPKENTLEYPQSSPSDLMNSLKKAIDNDDFAYMCSYLLFYEDKTELERTMAFVEAKKNERDSVVFTEKEKQDMINILTDIESSLNDLKCSGEDRFAFELEHKGAVYYFQNKNGTWKINPRSTSMVRREMKIPTRL